MKDSNRDKLRKKQDKLLDLAHMLGIDTQLQIDSNYAGSPKLCDLVNCIHPDWEKSIDYAIRYMESNQPVTPN